MASTRGKKIKLMRPTIFIGSSSEALVLAKAVYDEFAKYFDVDLWAEDIFRLGDSTLDNLLQFLPCYDFAVLVITDDDKVVSRGIEVDAPRDNVIFELGLFMGALGRRRVFPLIAKTRNGAPKIPSDLLGTTTPSLPKDFHKNIDPNELGRLLTPIVNDIREKSKQSSLQLLPSTGLAIGYFQNFILPVCQALTVTQNVKINDSDNAIGKGNFKFLVVLPSTLSDASMEGARKFTKKRNAQEFVLKTNTRSFPFFVDSRVENGNVIFYDYPTTLRASHEAIKIALAGPYLGAGDRHAILDKKEIENFQRTLKILLQDSHAAGFRDHVEIVQLS
jgi:hypothetical protein